MRHETVSGDAGAITKLTLPKNDRAVVNISDRRCRGCATARYRRPRTAYLPTGRRENPALHPRQACVPREFDELDPEARAGLVVRPLIVDPTAMNGQDGIALQPSGAAQAFRRAAVQPAVLLVPVDLPTLQPAVIAELLLQARIGGVDLGKGRAVV